MKVQTRDSSREKLILAGMIMSDVVLGAISARWEPQGLFINSWANLIGRWCVRFYTKYEKAPRKGIKSLFSKWAESSRDEETTRLVSFYLESLPDFDTSNYDHIIDEAGSYFNKIKYQKLAEEIQGHIDANNLEEAEKAYTSFNKLEMGAGAGIDLVNDEQAILSTFAVERKESLITYPGALRKFFLHSLERDSFIAFQAAEKVGKTWTLIDMAYRALSQRRKVAFFSVGDLSENQIKERFLVRITKHPSRSNTGKWPSFAEIPTAIARTKNNSKSKITVKRKKVSYATPLDHSISWKACKDLMENKIKSKESYFKLSCHPNDSISIMGIKSILESWAIREWVPDVVIIDYADLLSPFTKGETRDQIDATWKKMRAISQIYHCLMVTATQSNAQSYGANLQDRKYVSNDKRKLAHTTGTIGINVSDEEKKIGKSRLNWIVKREGLYYSSQVVHTAGCLSIGNPYMLSIF